MINTSLTFVLVFPDVQYGRPHTAWWWPWYSRGRSIRHKVRKTIHRLPYFYFSTTYSSFYIIIHNTSFTFPMSLDSMEIFRIPIVRRLLSSCRQKAFWQRNRYDPFYQVSFLERPEHPLYRCALCVCLSSANHKQRGVFPPVRENKNPVEFLIDRYLTYAWSLFTHLFSSYNFAHCTNGVTY